MMNNQTRVTWTNADGSAGSGITVSNEANGHVLVAVDNPVPGGQRRVIYCAVTWLKLEA